MQPPDVVHVQFADATVRRGRVFHRRDHVAFNVRPAGQRVRQCVGYRLNAAFLNRFLSDRVLSDQCNAKSACRGI